MAEEYHIPGVKIDQMLEVRNLSFRYPNNDNFIWLPLNLLLRAGEVVVIQGSNGSGKTTLLHCLCGIIPQIITGEMKGEVLYLGESISALSLKEIAPKINILFQEPEKQIFMPVVEDEIAFGPENLALEREEILQRVNDLLKRFRIGHLRKSSTTNLSFGQKKLVVLASILAIAPEVILIDEFTAGMEDAVIDLFIEHLKELKKEGKLIILADHHSGLTELADQQINLDELRYGNTI